MPDIFLSYSREDQATARRFAEGLQREGFDVWWDQALDAGETFDKVTERALKEAKAVVVLWSGSAVESRWVRSEATQADRYGTLVPVTIEPCDRPIMFELTHTADLSGWQGDPADPRWRSFIEGLRRFVSRGDTLAPTSAAPVLPPSAPSPASSPRIRKTWVTAGAALLILAAGLLWYFQGRNAAPAATATRASSPAGETSVAVLPFRDMSPNKDQEYFADGITEEILNALSRVRGLTVTARTSSFAFKGKDVSLREVGEALRVEHLLEGSVRKDGDQLRITAQLIDARTDAHLWSRTWNRPLQDVFKVQEEIATAVAETLQVSLGVGMAAQVPGVTRNVEAFEEWLAAGGPRGGVDTSSPATIQNGINHLERAVQIDPAFAAAWIPLAAAYRAASIARPGPPDRELVAKADAAVAEAERLAPDAFYVKFAGIERSLREGAWNEVARLYEETEAIAARQGISLNMDGDRAAFSLIVGRAREGVIQWERFRDRNPLDPLVAWYMGEAYADAGNLKAALDEFDRGLKLENPPVQLLGTAFTTALATGDRRLVESRMDALDRQVAGSNRINPAMKPLLDKPAEAVAELRRMLATPQDAQQLSAISVWAAWFGEPELALEALHVMVPRRNAGDLLRFWRPIMKDMRKLPGFKDIVRELGLVDYWREYGWSDFCKPVGDDDFECS